MENLKEVIGENLAALRKARGLTQAELGEIFSYTDRAVSKWENGDTLPDIDTLYAIAKFYNVTLDDLTKPENKDKIIKESKYETRNHIFISILTSMTIWMIATIIFVFTMLYQKIDVPYWLVFIWAVPVNALLIIFFNRFYFRLRILYYILWSIIIWSLLAAIFLQILIFGGEDANTWPIFLLGIPMQISLILWANIHRQRSTIKKENK